LKDLQYYRENKNLWFDDSLGFSLENLKEKVVSATKECGLFLWRSGKCLTKESLLELSNTLGTALNQSAQGCEVFEVKDEGYEKTDPRFRGPSSNRQLSFHTDRCDLILFHCIRQASKGGVNLFVHAETIYSILEEESPELLRVLVEDFLYKRHNADPANPLSCYELPIFGGKKERVITLMTWLIEQAHQDSELPNLSELQLKSLFKIQEICQRKEVHLEVSLKPGDLLFLNNLQMLHSRTAFEASGNRLYYRVWLAVPWSVKLPDSFEELFGATAAGAVRGGFKKF
jgi:hypothetical protein